MKNVVILYRLEQNFGFYKNVKLDITYSGGENENELEYEGVTISNVNNYTKKKAADIEKLIESGFEEDIINKLTAYYKDSQYKFSVN